MLLRNATLDDAALLLEWRNDPETRRQSRSTDPVSWGDHVAWLGRVLDDPDRLLLVAEDEEGPVGTVRFDVEDGRAEVSVTVAPERRGEGLAALLIRAGTEQMDVPVDAWVKEGNVASVKAFERAGYERVACRDGWRLLVIRSTRRG